MDETSELESMRPEATDAPSEAAEYAAFVARAVQHGSVDDGDDDDEWGDEPVAEEAAAKETPSEQASTASDEDDGEDAEADVQGINDSLKAALKLDALPDDLLDLLVSSGRDDLVAKYAESRAKNQRAVSQAFQELAEFKKKAEAASNGHPEAQAQPKPDRSALTQRLSEELGEETAGAVVDLADALTADLRAELQALKDAQAASLQERIQSVVMDTRQSLRERFPQVADDAAWQAVFTSAAALESHPKLAHIVSDEERARKALEWAARDEYGDAAAKPADAPRRNGKGPTPPRRKSPAQPVSSEQRDFERWKAKVESGR